MLKAIAFFVTAGAVAFVALLGHWETDPKPAPAFTPAPTETVAAQSTSSAGVPWLPIAVGLIATLAAVLIWVAWRRRSATGDAPTPAAGDETPAEPMHGRWWIDLTVNGYTIHKDYWNWPAPNAQVLARETERRYIAKYGADLPPGARVRAHVSPATADAK